MPVYVVMCSTQKIQVTKESVCEATGCSGRQWGDVEKFCLVPLTIAVTQLLKLGNL